MRVGNLGDMVRGAAATSMLVLFISLAFAKSWHVHGVVTVATERTHLISTARPKLVPNVERLSAVLRMRAGKASTSGDGDVGSESESQERDLSPLFLRRRKAAVFSVLMAAFLNLLGFTMALPINVALRSHFGIGTGASFGSLSSAYPLGTLGAMFLWPRLSDRAGRRPVITLSLAGSGIGLALQCWAVHHNWPLRQFLACRVLTGFCAGAGPVAKAYLADVGAATGQLPRYMAWRDAANTLAFIAGPAIGGYLYATSKSLAVVIGTTAAGSLLAAALIFTFVRDEDGSTERELASATAAPAEGGGTRGSAAPPPHVAMQQACPLGATLWAAVATVCVISAFYNVGSSTFSAFFGPLAQKHANLSVQGIGAAYTALSAISFVVSTTIAAQVRVISSSDDPSDFAARSRPRPPPCLPIITLFFPTASLFFLTAERDLCACELMCHRLSRCSALSPHVSSGCSLSAQGSSGWA